MQNIIHRVVIDVDEKGAKTSGATKTDLIPGRGLRARISLVSHSVTVNRPFLFLIMTWQDIVCFAGICADPNEQSP